MRDKRYVISWISFFDNELHSEIIYGSDTTPEWLVLLNNCAFFLGVTDEALEAANVEDLRTLKQFAFDMDGMVEILEVPYEHA